MMRRALSLLFVVAAVSLVLPTPGAAAERCSGVAAPSAQAFLARLASPSPAPGLDPAASPAHGALPAATFCTKEVCSAARAECRASCPLSCVMNFQCNFPTCNSCQCTC